MLGWALKKGFQGATGQHDALDVGEDTTHIDVPDTPAPIFAARAIKNAIWGQPTATTVLEPTASTKTERAEPTTATATAEAPSENRSPNKPNSILLTPGTGTSRRKRVSFGHDVKAGNNIDFSPLAANSAGTGRHRRRTTLQQALENSRSAKPKQTAKPKSEATAITSLPDDESDGDWEDDICNQDVTLDINDPHSESGKYWKSEFNRYRDEAKSGMEKLVTFKANAKSYAAKKDAEASMLSQKLVEEQAKVVKLEEKIADMSAQIAEKRRRGTDKDNSAMKKDLAKSTAMISEYRDRVKELEALLKKSQSESNSARSQQSRINTSPRTEQNILEVSRELRKARSELRQLDRYRDEVKQLKSDLAASQRRVAKLEEDKLLSHGPESTRVQRLEKQLREVKEESREKDRDLRKLRKDYETLKNDAKARTVEAMQVLQAKNDKISELEKIIKALGAANVSSHHPKDLDTAIAEHNRITRDLKSGIQSLTTEPKEEKARPIQRPKRSASVEDITLDMTQRSLLGEKQRAPERTPMEPLSRHNTADWAVSFDFEEQLKKDRKERIEAEKGEKELIMVDPDVVQPLPTFGTRAPVPSAGSRRAVSDVLSNRVNDSSPKDSMRRVRVPTNKRSSSNNQGKISGSAAGLRASSLAIDRAEMHGALDKAASRAKPQAASSRPLSSGSEAPGIDLVQDQFARLGGPEAERTSSGNTSRCALPADRQAAARARLQQKRLRRQKVGDRELDKENVMM
ncbi:Uu.00g084730.m01.CDS01 [Anthostomella pinea]|uniref:Uu.00g084730.m01.CDS01 n=1 Tax=Anthostomella pinea TaxID=933095 RepID=A0AAI8VMG8_9PEZI|nr:Uu.00g084730.m01.CDS01 [Anthostomella pinea]